MDDAPHPITTAPADTARAMHAAEMRGSDMQDAPERIWVAGTPQECGQYFPSCVEAEGTWGGVGVEYTRTDLCITDAECQRRIDAAVHAEREACEDMLNNVAAAVADKAPLTARAFHNAAVAICARWQK